MRKNGIILFVLLACLNLVAQNNPFDSLNNVLKKIPAGPQSDTTRLSVLVLLSDICEINQIAVYAEPAAIIAEKLLKDKNLSPDLKIKYSNRLTLALNNIAFMHKQLGNYDKALQMWEKCLSVQENTNDRPGIALTLNNISAVYYGKGNADKAIEYLNKSMAISEKDNNKPGIGICLNNIALICYNRGDVPKAINYYNKSLAIYSAINNKDGIATILNNIGAIYKNQEDHLKSLEYFHKSLKLREEINDKAGIAAVLNNIGTIYKQIDSIGTALKYYKKSLLIRQEIVDKSGVAESNFNLGSLYDLKDSTDIAMHYLTISQKNYEELEDKSGLTAVLNSIAKINFKKGNLNEALKNSSRSLASAKELGYPEPIKNAALLSYQIENKLKQWKNAAEHYELYITMRDSLANEEILKATIKQQIQYDYDKQKLLNKTNHEREMALSNEKAQKQKILNALIVAGLFIVLLFAIFIFNRLRISNKQKQIIEEQKELVEMKNHVIEEKQKEIIDSINYAKRIQYTLLAHEDLLRENLPEHFVYFNPKDIVSGDFYWATKKGNRFYLAVCDSTGHGVPGAFMSLLNISFLNEAINEKNIYEPHLILNHVRKRLIENISKDGGQDGMDALLICIEKNDTDKKANITYAAANNPPLIIQNGAFIYMDADKMPVGKGERNDSFTLRNLDINAGDTIYLYTDGFADQFGGPKGKKFKYKQLNELLLSNSSKTMKDQEEQLNVTFENWRGRLEQIDDVCIIGLKI